MRIEWELWDGKSAKRVMSEEEKELRKKQPDREYDPNWGGARPGAHRPRKFRVARKVTITMEEAMYNAIYERWGSRWQDRLREILPLLIDNRNVDIVE